MMTRRDLIGAAGTIAGSAALATVPVQAGATPSRDDAELIALIREYDRLIERAAELEEATDRQGFASGGGELDAYAAADALYDRAEAVRERIAAMRPSTPAGVAELLSLAPRDPVVNDAIAALRVIAASGGEA